MRAWCAGEGLEGHEIGAKREKRVWGSAAAPSDRGFGRRAARWTDGLEWAGRTSRSGIVTDLQIAILLTKF